jgi:flagellar basal body rod protein FlgG
MLANQFRQDVIANNLANADTAGFKRDFALLAQQNVTPAARSRLGPQYADDGVLPAGVRTDFSQGPLITTGQPLDAALNGPGFFAVSLNGQKLLTRDGRMRLDADGRLLSAADGAEILGTGGAAIRTNPRGGPLSITEDGELLQDGSTVGQLDVEDVADSRLLTKVGTARFSADATHSTAIAARVSSGQIESSASEPVKELVSMIEASRAYQLNAQMVSLQDETAGRLIGAVTQG